MPATIVVGGQYVTSRNAGDTGDGTGTPKCQIDFTWTCTALGPPVAGSVTQIVVTNRDSVAWEAVLPKANGGTRTVSIPAATGGVPFTRTYSGGQLNNLGATAYANIEAFELHAAP